MPDLILNDSHKHLLQPDIVLPTQFFASLRRKGLKEPEHRLAIAILEDAVDCFRKHIQARNRKAQKLHDDAKEWIYSSNTSWPFSFENICDVLKINPDYLRSGLKRWKESQLAGRASRQGGRLVESRAAA